MSEPAPPTSTETPTHSFSVFLSHNSREKPAVERIAAKLKREGLEPWLDKWCLTPAGDWQDELAAGLRASETCAVFVGPNGLGSWEDLEYKLATDRMAKDRSFRVFLVLLPGLPEPFDTSQLPSFLSIRTWVDLRKGIEDARSFQSLINAIKGIPLGPETPIEQRDDVCPYRGLQTFDEEHAEYFYGRDGDIQRLVEKLKATRFLAVVGPSGSGKSSLVRAGVIPAIKKGGLPESDTWTVRVFTPGARPLTALAANLLRLYPQESMNRTLDQLNEDERTLHLSVSFGLSEQPQTARTVLVIDQFEEVFTLCRDERERTQFLANLLYAAFIPDGQTIVVLTLRADFYHKCAAYPELSSRIAAQQFLVSLMSADNLRQAIEEPAWHTGLEFEQGLVGTILDDVENQPGALPLLEHALLELWERRRGTMLTLEAYRESGGVEGAIAKRADAIYNSFDAEQQTIARRIMLRLTQPGEGTEDTRRRALMSELITNASESGAVEGVVRAMTESRLLMTDSDGQSGEQIVDVSHEALIRGWPLLRKWIEEDRAGLRILRRLTEAAREWQPLKDESLLYRGARLAQAVEWRERNETALNELERGFLNASIAARQAVERRRKGIIIGLVAGLIIAVGLAGLALFQWRRADEQVKIALSRLLAAESLSQMDTQPDLAFLLVIEANRAHDSLEARSIMLQDMQYREYLTTLLHGNTAEVHQVTFSPDGKLLATASGTGGRDNSVRLWNTEAGQPIGEALAGHQAAVRCVSFSSDGKILASGDDAGVVMLWDVATRKPLGQPLTGHRAQVFSLAFSPDNKILASGSNVGGGNATGEIYLWNVAMHERIGESLKGHTTFVKSLAFSPDGKTLASGNGRTDPTGIEASIILWDVATRKPLGSPLTGHGDEISCLTFNPDGRVLASGSADKTVRLWDVAARKPLKDFEILNQDLEEPHKSGILDVKFTGDGKKLISVDAGSIDIGSHALVRTIELSNANDGKLALVNSDPTRSFVIYFRKVDSISINPETMKWAAAAGCRKTGAANECLEAEVSIWNVAVRLPITRLVAEELNKSEDCVAFSPDGKLLASGGCAELGGGVWPDEICLRGEVRLWDAATRQPLGQLQGATGTINSLAYSPNGKILAAGGCAKFEKDVCQQGEIRLWNPDTRQLVSQPLTGHDDFVAALAFSPDGKTLASSGGSGNVILWNAQTGQRLGEITTGHQYKIGNKEFTPVTIAFSPDGKTLVSGGCGKIAQRADSSSASSDVCGAGEIRFWDVATRQLLGQPLAAHDDEVMSLAFSPDGKTLASSAGQSDGKIKLWDVATRQTVGRDFMGYAADMKKVVFSPDGKTLVSIATIVTEDKRTYNIFLWDVASRQLIGQPLAAHTGKIMDIAFSPDGRTLASGGSDRPLDQKGTGGSVKRLRLWDMSLEKWMASACGVANRNLTQAEWERYFPNQTYHKTCPNLPESKE